jgi:hypothetical protein
MSSRSMKVATETAINVHHLRAKISPLVSGLRLHRSNNLVQDYFLFQ